MNEKLVVPELKLISTPTCFGFFRKDRPDDGGLIVYELQGGRVRVEFPAIASNSPVSILVVNPEDSQEFIRFIKVEVGEYVKRISEEKFEYHSGYHRYRVREGILGFPENDPAIGIDVVFGKKTTYLSLNVYLPNVVAVDFAKEMMSVLSLRFSKDHQHRMF